MSETAVQILARMGEMAEVNSRPIDSVAVQNPHVHGYDAEGKVTVSVNIDGGVNDRLRAEIRQEALVRGWDIR